MHARDLSSSAQLQKHQRITCGSLFQKTAEPFTDDHGVLFGEGLRASNIFYSHRDTVVWMQPSLPDGFSGNSYEESGEPHTTPSSLLTPV